MNQGTIEATETAIANCKNCNRAYTYEPLMIGNRDFGLTMNPLCPECEAAKEAWHADVMRAALEDKREAQVRSQIPPDLLDTDIFREGFNYGLWSVFSQWGPNGDFWLAVVGAAGKCKTRCMALLAAQLIRQGVRVCWTTANRLKDATADRNHRERAVSMNAREHLADCMHASWLFIDDLGKNEWTPAFESQFFQLLDHRKNYRLPVVYSSNAHPSEFSQVISPLNASPIIGRLLDRTTLIDLF